MFCFFEQRTKQIHLNPITYGILRFRQLRGGGGGGGKLFGPDPEIKGMVNGLIWNLVLIMVRMILVTMQNFKVLAFLLLEIWRHKNFLSRMEQVIAIRYLPLESSKTRKKSLFMPENIFPYTPSAFPWFWRETKKIPYVPFFETSHFKNNCSNPLVNRFC